MQVLHDGDVDVHYGFLALAPESEVVAELIDARGGQRNGLCGARIPGCLSMVTGLHTGRVPVRVELHAVAPEVGDEWEEVVEVSMTVRDGEGYLLSAFDDWHELTGLAPGPHRARWCAAGMDAGKAMDCPDEGERAPDRYLLQLWPARPEPDTVLRQTAEIAAYWHGVAAATPIPDPATFRPQALDPDDEPAETSVEIETEPGVTSVELESDSATSAAMTAAWRSSPFWLAMWGGRAPEGELAEWDERAARVAPHDRDLLDRLVTIEPARQRALALWAARRACERAEIDTLPWVAEALERVHAGERLEGPWADGTVFAQLPQREGTTFEIRVTVDAPVDRERIPWARDVAAVDAVLGASDEHPGVAAAIALGALLDAYEVVDEGLAEVRAAMRS